MKLLRDPLVHFIAIGAVLFGLFAVLDENSERRPDEIVVTTGQIASLQEVFARTWQRPPTAAETESLVAEYVRDEVLYREALSMGLDQDDTIIRRRLRQKLEFIADIASDSEPSDEELKAFVAERPEQFRREPRASFTHVYFTAENPPGSDEIARLRRALDDGAANAAESGDAFMPGYDFEDISRSDTAELFGAGFAEALDGLPLDSWQGPIPSAYGTHLVRVGARSAAADLPFERIREIVRREWLNERRLAAGDALYEKLRERYAISIEPPPEVPSGRQVAEAEK